MGVFTYILHDIYTWILAIWFLFSVLLLRRGTLDGHRITQLLGLVSLISYLIVRDTAEDGLLLPATCTVICVIFFMLKRNGYLTICVVTLFKISTLFLLPTFLLAAIGLYNWSLIFPSLCLKYLATICVKSDSLLTTALPIIDVATFLYSVFSLSGIETFIASVFLLLASVLLIKRLRKRQRHAMVIVLGDIGRSPRMQYHTLSLASLDYTVDVVGYDGSDPIPEIRTNKRISLVYMTQVPDLLSPLPKLLQYVIKVIFQIVIFGYTFLRRGTPSHILIQNPPSIPVMMCAVIYSWITGCKLVIDWHNYGYTILALALRDHHPLVKFSKTYEKFWGWFADHNLCVTDAMRKDLQERWGVHAVTLYDRPPAMFRPNSPEETHKLIQKLSLKYEAFSTGGADCNRLTRRVGGVAEELPQRPLLLVSSTSWTEDEDFSLLLEALQLYDTQREDSLPEVICVITGKGPLKAHYCSKMAALQLSRVTFVTPWLDPEDYPRLLGAADVGVCLHTSSSGLDLPMKVVDMFGCQLPVLAVHFRCIGELVQHEHNGMVFTNRDELFRCLLKVSRNFRSNESLQRYRRHLAEFGEHRWDQAWTRAAASMFR